jgi:hypothetical protein
MSLPHRSSYQAALARQQFETGTVKWRPIGKIVKFGLTVRWTLGYGSRAEGRKNLSANPRNERNRDFRERRFSFPAPQG